MSALLKNMYVQFESATKSITDNELADNGNGDDRCEPSPVMLNYSREKLLEFGQSKASKEPPKMFDLSGADDKRMEKIRHVLKNSDFWKSLKNSAIDGAVVSNDGVAEHNATQKEQVRTNFQQMISTAVSNAQQQNEYAAATAAVTNHRRRIGSGRIPDQNFTAPDNSHAIGMDVRYMRNKLFKDDGKMVKNWKSGNDWINNWNHADMATQASDIDNADAKSDEPEWANCGPISKHDIIELHGFDGPEEDDMPKSEGDATLPPQRNSTPSKSSQKKTVKDDHFNFEDFLKLDLPPTVNCSRDVNAGESRFSQWFGRDKQSHSNGKFAGNSYDGKTPQQFFDYHQKANQKNAPNKLRSVNELEADWCPTPSMAHQSKIKEQKTQPMVKQQAAQQQPDINTIRTMLNQLAAALPVQQQRSMNSAQSNFLLSLINKSAENLYQYRLSQNAIMERPDAQLLLHRLINGETTQLHILQHLNTPGVHQRDRETMLAVFAFWNENQQQLVQQQKQQLKYKEQMSQQLRQLQMIQMKNSGFMQTPTPQELQIHTQNIMQNAMYKKQFEDQYRHLQNFKIGNQSKFQSYNKPNNSFMPNQPYNNNNNRFNYKQQKQTQFGQNGLQFIQAQNKMSWNRQNPTGATGNFPFMNGSSSSGGMRTNTNNNDLFGATMPSFAKLDSTTMGGIGGISGLGVGDKVPITVEK